MWTHKHPYRELLSSKKRIEYHGKAELFRSLNKGRLIAFTGSGLTLAYGRLTWGELSRLLIMAVDYDFWRIWQSEKRPNRFNKSEAKHLHQSLRAAVGVEKLDDYQKRFRDAKNTSGTIYSTIEKTRVLNLTLEVDLDVDKSLLELCSDLSRALGKPNFLKEQCAEMFMEGLVGQFGRRLALVDGMGDGSFYQDWRRFKKIDKNKIKWPDELCEKDWKVDEKFARHLIETRPWKMLEKSLFIPHAFIAEDIKNVLRLIFEVLSFIQNAPDEIVQGKWPDPVKAVVEELDVHRIVTLNYDTDIERYLLKSQGYNIDDNDHLFAPKTAQSLDSSQRVAIRENGFGVKMKSVTLSKGMVGNLVDFAALSSRFDSYVFHLHGRADFSKDLILTEKDYQNLYIRTSKMRTSFKEGLTALFGGNDVLFVGVGMSEADLLHPLRQFISEARNITLYPDGIAALLARDIGKSKNEKRSLQLKTEMGIKTLLYKRGGDGDRKTVKKLSEKASKLGIEPIHQGGILRARLLVKAMISSRNGVAAQSKALVSEIEDLAIKQKKWLVNWKQSPGKRKALFRGFSLTQSDLDRVCIRQKVISYDEDSYEKFKSFRKLKTFKAIVHQLKNTTPRKREIIRFAGPTGVGKGSLVHALQQASLHEKPFLREPYYGCFFADARFSTEFNSVISALVRFLAGRIAKKIGKQENEIKAIKYNAFKKEFIKKELGIEVGFGRTGILKSYFQAIIDERFFDKNQRIFVCLSGLDHLTDGNGYAYNALHRDFFKCIIDPMFESLPFDFVLISGERKTPIRYLSDTKNSDKNWDDQTAKLKQWNLIGPTCKVVGFHDRSREAIKRPWLENSKADKALGIYGDNEEFRPYLRKVAIDSVACHVWLRALSVALEDTTLRFNSKQKNAFYDRLELAASQDGRLGVVGVILDLYQTVDTSKGTLELHIFQLILRHLALFALPIERSVLAGCPGIQAAIRDNLGGRMISESDVSKDLEKYLKKLCKHGLLVKIEGGRLPKDSKRKDKDKISYRYTLNSLLREELSRRMKFGVFNYSECSFFDVSLVAVQPMDLPSPKEDDFALVGQILQALIIDSRDTLSPFYKIRGKKKTYNRIREQHKNTKRILKNLDSIQSLPRRMRAAVSLVNGIFSIGVISRLENTNDEMEDICGSSQPFECYRGWLRGILNVSVAIKKQEEAVYFAHKENTKKHGYREKWLEYLAFGKKLARDEVEGHRMFHPPLYATEIAWLYNERAVVSLIQGRVFDALPLFKLAKKNLLGEPWSNLDDPLSKPTMTSLRRVQLNEAIAFIEFGELRKAEKVFLELYGRKSKSKRNKNSLTVHLAAGYLGLCYHLRGDKIRAKSCYLEALKYFSKDSTQYLRALSIFRQHLGNLYRSMNQFDEARRCLDLAIESAASSKQMDVYHHVRISKVKLMSLEDKSFDHRLCFEMISDAFDYAEKMGVYKLKVHSEIMRGQLLLDQDQLSSAGKAISNAIALANKHGMRLSKISSLLLYERLLIKRDVNDNLIQDVHAAIKKLREKTGYML